VAPLGGDDWPIVNSAFWQSLAQLTDDAFTTVELQLLLCSPPTHGDRTAGTVGIPVLNAGGKTVEGQPENSDGKCRRR